MNNLDKILNCENKDDVKSVYSESQRIAIITNPDDVTWLHTIMQRLKDITDTEMHHFELTSKEDIERVLNIMGNKWASESTELKDGKTAFSKWGDIATATPHNAESSTLMSYSLHHCKSDSKEYIRFYK